MSRTLAAVATPLVTASALVAAPAPAERVHVRRSGEVAVELPLDRALALFTAEGERAWAPGWDPAHHFPADGSPAEGAAFSTTAADGRVTHWIVVDWKPELHRARYARVTPGLRAGTVEVVCRARDAAATVATVTYDLVSLSPEGDADLATWSEAWYRDFLASWEREIAAALAR